MNSPMGEAGSVRHSELVGRGVMAYEQAEEIGRVDYFLVDGRQVVGIACKLPGVMGRKLLLSWDQLVSIGGDSLVVHQPQGDRPSEVEIESHLAAAQNRVGLELWTDGGDHIGTVVDLALDAKTGAVQQYLFAPHSTEPAVLPEERSPEPSGETDSDRKGASADSLAETSLPKSLTVVYAISPSAVISAGRRRMMVAENDARAARPYGEPMDLSAIAQPSRPAWAADWHPESLAELPKELAKDLPHDFGELWQRGQSLAGKVTEQVKQRAKQFGDEQFGHQDWAGAEKLPDISQQLQAKGEQFKEQMQARLEKAKEQLDQGLDDTPLGALGKMPWGRKLSRRINRFTHNQRSDLPSGERQSPEEPIDIDAFEVWEEDELT